jgi:hypothetical protein
MPVPELQSLRAEGRCGEGAMGRNEGEDEVVPVRLQQAGRCLRWFELGPPGRQRGKQRRLAGVMAQAADDTAAGSGGMRGCAGQWRWSSGLCGWAVVDRKALQPPTSGALGGKVVASLARKLGDGRAGQSNDADDGPAATP